MEKSNAEEKALFLQRLLAFLIDLFIVTMLASIIAGPFLNNKKIESLNNKSVKLVEKYNKKKINLNEYIAEYTNITYDLARETGPTTIIELLLGIVFYIIIPLYNDGKSIGKMVMKIKIKSNDGELTANQLIFRSFIANSMLINIISLILLIFTSRSVYFYCLGLFLIIQYVITFISVFMIMFTKCGLTIHDKLVNTKVVKC